MSTTTIEWADETRNAASGCTEARLTDGSMSEECVRCYARLQSARMPGLMRGGEPSARKAQIAALYDGVAERRGRGAAWTGVLRWDRELLDEHLDALTPGKITFLGSLTDLWHENHDPALGAALAAGIRRRDAQPRRKPRGLVGLTKRAERQLAWQREHFPEGLPSWVWPGVTAGTQRSAEERLPFATQLRASVIVVSAEPLLGEMDLTSIRAEGCGLLDCEATWLNALTGVDACAHGNWGGHGRVGWVLTGCESGHGRRPTDPAWVRSLRDQCAVAGVPFFLKQGEVDGAVVGTPDLDGRTWTEVPRG